MCIAMPNFVIIGQTVVEVSHLTVFTARGYAKRGICRRRVTVCLCVCVCVCVCVSVTLRYCTKTAAILDFQIFKHLVTRQVGMANMHCHTKFNQNWSYG